jgi:hypothetical protein
MPNPSVRCVPAALVALAGSSSALAAAPFPSPFPLASLNGANGFAVPAVPTLAYSVAVIGDINGDGQDELVLGDIINGPGAVYVVFGGGPWPAAFDPTTLDGTNGFVFEGAGGGPSLAGFSVSGGDINGDGFGDVIIGSPGAPADNPYRAYAGAVYVVFGGPTVGATGEIDAQDLDGANGFAIAGRQDFDYLGTAVDSAGDVNGDGFDDVLIGAYVAYDPAAPPGGVKTGAAYIVFGGPSPGPAIIDAGALDGSNGLIAKGPDEFARTGRSVAAAGDVNGDGFDDVVIGAPYADDPAPAYGGTGVNAGAAYIVFGRQDLGSGLGNPAILSLEGLDGTFGLIFRGLEDSANAGFAVSGGDIDGDGLGDTLIGAPRADGFGTDIGISYVVFGTNAFVPGGRALPGFIIEGAWPDGESGSAVSAKGDVNGDGFDDIIVGAPEANPDMMGGDEGEVAVLFGASFLAYGGSVSTCCLDGYDGFVVYGLAGSTTIGAAVASGGDISGDGIDDLAFATGYSVGDAYAIFGVAANEWISPANGFFDDFFNWRGRQPPLGGTVIIDTPIGVTVTGPQSQFSRGGVPFPGARFIDRLVLGAQIGRTTLDLQPDSLLAIAQTLELRDSAAITGAGTLACEGGVLISGLLGPSGMSALTPGPIIVNEGGLVDATDSIIQANDIDVRPGARFSATGCEIISQTFRVEDAGVLEADGSTFRTDFFGVHGDGRLQATDAIITGDLFNEGDVNLESFGGAPHDLEVAGQLINGFGGEIFVFGDATIRAGDRLFNEGTASFAASNAIVHGEIENSGFFGGERGISEGVLSFFSATHAILTGDVLNGGTIVVAPDSSLVILGSLTGNGVVGPNGLPAGDVLIEGDFFPGPPNAPGVAAFEGDVSLGGASLTLLEIGGESNLDRVITTANLGAGGTLVVTLVGGYTPQPGDVYDVLDFDTVSGGFASIALDPQLVAAGADTSMLLTTGEILVPASACAGDVNGDGATDIFDFADLADNFGAGPGATREQGDLTGDGFVDVFDFGVLADDFGCGL